MFNIGTGEIVVIAVVALLVLGPKRLPELARGIGKFMREFRRQTDEVRGVVEREFYKMDHEINAVPPVPAPTIQPAQGLVPLDAPHDGLVPPSLVPHDGLVPPVAEPAAEAQQLALPMQESLPAHHEGLVPPDPVVDAAPAGQVPEPPAEKKAG